MLHDTIINSLTTKLVAKLQPEKIVLFGSRARQTHTSASDADLLVVLRTDLPRPRRARLVYSALDPYPYPLDILVYTPDEVAYWQDTPASLVAHIMREGTVLYERTNA